ncbi:thioesterase family protein [Streptomyces hygroscopicus]|uniref:thioesterase family protein n=1 Tax=Streptomyces hygroscopicus TaxID=1912 RepID=UPI00363CD3BE
MTSVAEPERSLGRASGSEFDQATGVTSEGPHAYRAELPQKWRVGGGINGGLVLAVAARALGAELDGSPFAVTAHYLSASRAGVATVRTKALKRGRSLSTGTASLLQADKATGELRERVHLLGTYGDHSRLDGEVRTSAVPPDLPPLDECLPIDGASIVTHMDVMDRTEIRYDPSCLGWLKGKPSGRGVMQGWVRLADGRDPDPLSLLFVVDALAPVAVDFGLPGWCPTLELTAHVRADPAPGWLRVRHSTRNFAGGLLEEDAEVWDSAGRLVAQSRQLAKAPKP